MKITTCLFLLLLCCQSALAQENFCDTGKPHAIDVWFEKEMDKTEGVTVNIRAVQSEAYSRWDKELNRVYGELMNKFNAADKMKLREAQRAWLKFYEAETELLWAKALFGDEGTSGPISVSERAREIVRQRVCTLLRYKQLAERYGN